MRRAFDLVVADLRLPDVADIEVLKQLRQTLADVPVIVTGLASTASAIEAGKLGAVDYFEKPILRDHLDPVWLARTFPTRHRHRRARPTRASARR